MFNLKFISDDKSSAEVKFTVGSGFPASEFEHLLKCYGLTGTPVEHDSSEVKFFETKAKQSLISLKQI